MSRSLSYPRLGGRIIAPALVIAAALAAAPAGAHEVKRAAAPAAATRTAPAPAGALAALDAFHDALGRADTAAALARLADDVLIYEQGGAERSKSEYASHHLGSDAEFAKATRRQLTTRRSFAAGDLVVVTSETRTTGRFRDRDVDSLGKETAVLRRSGGDWRIVHVHWSSQKAPAPKP